MTDASFTDGLSIKELLRKAKRKIASGYSSMRTAAEYIAAAQERGATQRTIAEAVGKSPSWVNRLLNWRKGGFQHETPFGPQSKASRLRASRVQSAEHNKGKAEQQAKFWREQAERARGEAEQARDEAGKARAEAERAKAQARRAKAQARFDGASADYACISQKDRLLLVKALGMLSSNFEGERANAVSLVERQRQRLGFVWDDRIIPAAQVDADAA